MFWSLSFCDSKLCAIWLCNIHSQIQQNENIQSQFVQAKYDYNYDILIISQGVEGESNKWWMKDKTQVYVLAMHL